MSKCKFVKFYISIFFTQKFLATNVLEPKNILQLKWIASMKFEIEFINCRINLYHQRLSTISTNMPFAEDVLQHLIIQQFLD